MGKSELHHLASRVGVGIPQEFEFGQIREPLRDALGKLGMRGGEITALLKDTMMDPPGPAYSKFDQQPAHENEGGEFIRTREYRPLSVEIDSIKEAEFWAEFDRANAGTMALVFQKTPIKTLYSIAQHSRVPAAVSLDEIAEAFDEKHDWKGSFLEGIRYGVGLKRFPSSSSPKNRAVQVRNVMAAFDTLHKRLETMDPDERSHLWLVRDMAELIVNIKQAYMTEGESMEGAMRSIALAATNNSQPAATQIRTLSLSYVDTIRQQLKETDKLVPRLSQGDLSKLAQTMLFHQTSQCLEKVISEETLG